MSEGSLDDENVHTGFKHSGRESSAEIVWAQLPGSGLMCSLSDDTSDGFGRESTRPKRSRTMNGKEQGSWQCASKEKPALKGSCCALSEFRSSPFPAFAKSHQPVSVDMRQVEMRQLGATQTHTIEDGKNRQVTPATKGLVALRDGEKHFDIAS